jgi:hypothetical protein
VAADGRGPALVPVRFLVSVLLVYLFRRHHFSRRCLEKAGPPGSGRGRSPEVIIEVVARQEGHEGGPLPLAGVRR